MLCGCEFSMESFHKYVVIKIMKSENNVRKSWKKFGRVFGGILLTFILTVGNVLPVQAAVEVTSPSAILVEASTGTIIFEKNSTERRSPASVTKVMTLLLAFEQIDAGKIKLEDMVMTSEHAMSMGGSQVYLETGETQTMETMIKCIVISSGNDACVAVAEHIAGTESEFVAMMNDKAAQLGMADTHFEDCCGLTESENHYTSARDIAIMSRELITKHPKIFDYTKIWMEDITHTTARGSSTFTLSSTNKLLKQYEWTTGLKTGFTSKAMYCLSATASKDGIDMIAVVMGAPDSKTRSNDVVTLFNYGYSVSRLYKDENKDNLSPIPVKQGVAEEVNIGYKEGFRYLDVQGRDLSQIEKIISLPEEVQAPLKTGEPAGEVIYKLGDEKIGSVPILYMEDVPKAAYKDYLRKAFEQLLL